MVWNQVNFNGFVSQSRVIGFKTEQMTLKSGRKSFWYVNFRDIAGDAFLLDQLAQYIVSFADAKGLNPDCFYGIPAGASPEAMLATIESCFC